MSKVLVDRELLERAAARADVFDDGSDGADAESARSVSLMLREALAQPAEAEGVELRALPAREWAERAPSRNVVLEDEAIAALSAVTAERDRLRKDRDDCVEARVHYAGKLGEVMAERDQLRAEVEGRQVMPEGWGVKRVHPEDGVGFIIESPRANGVSSGAAVWSDAENPAEQMLALILDKVTK